MFSEGGLSTLSAAPQAPTPEFDGGGHFGIEIPSVNSLDELENLISLAEELDIPVSQVNEVIGASLIPDSELKEMLALAKQENVGLTLSSTVRPEYDVDTAFYRSPWGREYGRRINHPEKLRWAFDETLRLIDMGCTGFIIYDIGLARLIRDARKIGVVPPQTVVKASSHCAITNHVTAEIYAENGIDDIIAPSDLSLEALTSIRQAIPTTALSVVTDTYTTKGGFVRLFEVPKFLGKLCPCFLKMGNSLQHDPGSGESAESLAKRMRRIRAILDHAERALGSLRPISVVARLRAVPAK